MYEWLNPGSSEETEEAEEPKAETPTAPAPATSASKYSLNVKQKPDIDKEFDDLFKTDSTTNDLPF